MLKVPDFLQELAEQLAKESEQVTKKALKPDSEFQKKIKEVKKDLSKNSPRAKINGGGYEYVEDPTTGKMRVRSQVEWEKYHPGKKVEDHQKVIFRNGNKKDFSKENLIRVYKSGVSLDMLTCKNCGCRGNWEMEEIE